jgi:hypothetical protein
MKNFCKLAVMTGLTFLLFGMPAVAQIAKALISQPHFRFTRVTLRCRPALTRSPNPRTKIIQCY